MTIRGIHQVEAGAPWRFIWTPSARPKTAPAAPPDPAVPFVRFGAPLDLQLALQVIRAPATVITIASDRQTLTLNAPIGGAAGLIAEHGGHAWLDLGDAYQGAVIVAGFTDPLTAVLTIPLSYDPGEVGGTLEWRIWYADLDEGQVGAAVARAVPWSVRWESDLGADNPGRMHLDRGLVDVVKQPFDTGLDHHGFLEHYPLFAHAIPEGQTSWAPQIRSGLRELVDRVRAKLPVGTYLDQLAGEQFELAHQLFTAHVITRGMRATTYDVDHDFLAEASAAVGRQFGRLRWVDADDDGEVDAGETDVALGGVSSIGSSYTTTGYTPFPDIEDR